MNIRRKFLPILLQIAKSALLFLLLFVANEVQLMKANVQSVVVSFVQNESVVVSFVQNESVVVSFVQNGRNTLYQIDVMHLLICDKDRIFFFLGRSFSPKIFCLCLHSPLCQAYFLLSQRECRHYEYQF